MRPHITTGAAAVGTHAILLPVSDGFATILPPMSAVAIVNARGRARIAAGQPWVYRQDTVRGPATDATSGGPAVVLVTDERHRPLAHATWAAHSPLALRVLMRAGDADAPDAIPDLLALVETRLAA